jgi:pyruvate,water dikinase
VEGSILVAERATPEDVGRILASSGTLTLGGALLSHVSLLSREFGKPSVSLGPASRVRILPVDDARGVLELGDVVGSGAPPVLEEGDIVLLDGDHGTVRVPGGVDPDLRAKTRSLHESLRAYAAEPDRDDLLGPLLDDSGETGGPVFTYLLEAAFLNRIVPSGGPARRLLDALLQDPGRREGVERLREGLRRSVFRRAEAGFLSTEVEIGIAEAIDDLDRAVRRLETHVEAERLLIQDLGGDPAVLNRLVVPIVEQANQRRESLRTALGDRVVESLDLPDEALRHRLGGFLQLLRRARRAGLPDEPLDRLEERLQHQTDAMRAGVGDALVVPLSEAGPQDRGRVGGKAAGLLEIRAVLPERCVVPDGFVVASAAYRLHVLGEIEGRLQDALREADDAGASRRARAAILSAEVPDEVARAVRSALENLGAERVAVRSSATVEDGASGSLAGQFDTALGVVGLTDVLHRVRQTWASLWNARALRTMAASGLQPIDASQAVLVQEMVSTRSAGVLVTRDPAGRPDTLLINATWGLGEGISQGEVPGDLFWVRRSTGEVVRAEPGEGSTRIALDPGGTGTKEVPLDADQVGRTSLTNEEVGRLAELARVLEAATGRAQDVEFGFTDDGTLVVFQVRRVATARRHRGFGE